MTEWVPFADGEYLVERAFLVAPDGSAVPVTQSVIDVFTDAHGRRQLRGWGNIRNVLLVELLDDHDAIDLLLDLGQEFKYRLPTPELKAGKVFSPDVVSTLQFAPHTAWEQVAQDEFETLIAHLTILSLPSGRQP